MIDTFYNKEVISWYDSAMNLPNAKSLPAPSSFSGRLLRSPVSLAVGGLSLDDASAVAEQHVKRWLAFIADGKPTEARQKVITTPCLVFSIETKF